MLVLQVRKGMQIWEKGALMRIAKLKNSLAKVRKKKRMVTQVQWLCWRLRDNWVAYVKIWSRRSLHRFCGRAQTYGSQSDVFDSLKPWYVMLTFETRIHRLEWFAEVILISVTPMLQNLRIGFQEETEWEERCAREAAWTLAQNILKLKKISSILTFWKLVPACAINP